MKLTKKTGKTIEQVVYYQTGIGADQMTRLDSVWQGATGAGLEENVTTAYHYLANNYLSGKYPDEADEIFLFGFSRGAYTARALAGMVTEMGLLWPQELDKFPDLYKVYKKHGNRKDEGATNTKARKDSAVGNGENGHESDNSTIMKNTGKFWKSAMKMAKSIDGKIWDRIKQFHPDNDSEKSHIVHTIKIKVIGVWDTVGSRGLPESLLTWATGWNKKYQFHDTALNRKIDHAFHALSLDEHRGAFEPALWYLDRADADYGDETDLKQCWFPGYHADIGGGTTDRSSKDESGIDEITLAWMCDQVDGYLKFDADACEKLLFSRKKSRWAKKTTKDQIGWYWLPVAGGNVYRTPGQYRKNLKNENCAKGHGDNVTNETVHPSVRYRIDNSRNYDPPAFKRHSGWINTEGQAWKPRDYLKSLETRVAYLEAFLRDTRPEVVQDYFDGSGSLPPEPGTGSPATQDAFSSAARGTEDEEIDDLTADVAVLCLSAAGREPHYFSSSCAMSFSRIVSTTMGLPQRHWSSQHSGTIFDTHVPEIQRTVSVSFPAPALATTLIQACLKANAASDLSEAGDLALFFVLMV
ncbi:hypothetical protein SLS56_011649 [Neofusicoccum ribis]|uniref:T6SS Phospholipase effector Tle1-like catalytic domain-containing protein n=1 Tax=Neofusicoccum ribis TaxID=45134 RepID=A0ABR3SB54_9PEZI